MRQRSTLIFLAMALCTWLPHARAGEPSKVSLSAQQTANIISALAAATVDEAGLAALPVVAGRDVHLLTGTTGIHCIEPNLAESYHAITVMVGGKAKQQRHVVYFTLTPQMGNQANTLALASLLKGRTVTQYAVKPVGPGKPGSPSLFAYHARNPKSFCAVPPGKLES